MLCLPHVFTTHMPQSCYWSIFREDSRGKKNNNTQRKDTRAHLRCCRAEQASGPGHDSRTHPVFCIVHGEVQRWQHHGRHTKNRGEGIRRVYNQMYASNKTNCVCLTPHTFYALVRFRFGAGISWLRPANFSLVQGKLACMSTKTVPHTHNLNKEFRPAQDYTHFL
jgi:hypothetical protein